MRARLTDPLTEGSPLSRGHPWVFDRRVVLPAAVAAGQVVEVVEPDGSFVGLGIADPASPIAVRMWTRRPDRPAERIDEALIRARVEAALAERTSAGLPAPGVTDMFRLLHGESDRMPGVTCDVYGGFAVMQADTDAVAGLLPLVANAIAEVFPADLRGVLVKPRRPRGGGVVGLEVLEGIAPPEELIARENGMLQRLSIRAGHKSGAYLDQRDNRLRVRERAAGRRVLDLFAYTGGFAVSAALGCARSVTAVDASRAALEAARGNLRLNQLDPGTLGADGPSERRGHVHRPTRKARLALVAADVGRFLAECGDEFDLVVLDPPSLARRRSQVPGATEAYRRLNVAAMRRVANGGALLSCSCTSRISARDLRRIVVEAARQAGRQAKITDVWRAGPDHPVRSWFPEGDYLCALWVELGCARPSPRRNPGSKSADSDPGVGGGRSRGRRRGTRPETVGASKSKRRRGRVRGACPDAAGQSHRTAG